MSFTTSMLSLVTANSYSASLRISWSGYSKLSEVFCQTNVNYPSFLWNCLAWILFGFYFWIFQWQAARPILSNPNCTSKTSFWELSRIIPNSQFHSIYWVKISRTCGACDSESLEYSRSWEIFGKYYYKTAFFKHGIRQMESRRFCRLWIVFLYVFNSLINKYFKDISSFHSIQYRHTGLSSIFPLIVFWIPYLHHTMEGNTYLLRLRFYHRFNNLSIKGLLDFYDATTTYHYISLNEYLLK